MSSDNGAKTSASGEMISRFTGSSGQALLHDVLADESVLRGIPNLAEFIAGCELLEVAQGSELIRQGEPDNDLYIIVSGSFDMEINGRHITTRHVGNM
jgi:CRP/FNR family transcriptional regulator, cyclic AMP receptor protein